MRKLISIIPLGLLILTIGLPSLQSFLPESDVYLDRTILCRWIAAAKGDPLILDAVAQDESICPGAMQASPHYPYGKNCASKCDPLSIADEIVHGARETAVALKNRVRLIFGMRT